jgi:hypothetical protein
MKKTKGSQILFVSLFIFLFIFSCFLFIFQCETIKTYKFYLKCILMKKIKSFKILSVYLFIYFYLSTQEMGGRLSVYFYFLFSCFLFISQCSFANFTPNSGKRQEIGRVSNRCLSMKNYTTVIIIIFCAKTFIFHYISIVILYVFF